MRCPGQSSRYWGPDAIVEATCPTCGTLVEIFKDESRGHCHACGLRFPNPRLALGCAESCPAAPACTSSRERREEAGRKGADVQLAEVELVLPGTTGKKP